MNISLPEPMALLINKEISTGKYASKSEFFRALFRDWSEIKLAKELDQSRKEMKAGKGKLLRSLADLD
ncbi:TPA: type II toxin-antitoxin system ParD family antitoxin [Candidatus Collierbacteria bacterium]|nr:type II toxin-antitoxin system ParD family antitoxin [Candidatus Collierbacteria bacterium]